MHIANINEAKSNLSHLIRRALAGDEIIIARANEPLIRLQPYSRDVSPRIGGQWAGQFEVGSDFEFTEQEIDELFHSPIISEGE